jgi:hypothetical protein
MASAAAADDQYEYDHAAAVVSAEEAFALEAFAMASAAAAKNDKDNYYPAAVTSESETPVIHNVTPFI